MSSICIPVILKSNPMLLFVRLRLKEYKPFFYLFDNKIANGNEIAFIISIEQLFQYISQAKDEQVKKSKIIVFTNENDLNNHTKYKLLLNVIRKVNLDRFKPISVRIQNVSEVVGPNEFSAFIDEGKLIEGIEYLRKSYGGKPILKLKRSPPKSKLKRRGKK